MRAEVRAAEVMEMIHCVASGGTRTHWSCSDEVHCNRECVRSQSGGQGEKAHGGWCVCVFV